MLDFAHFNHTEVLDITDLRETGPELRKKIVEAVRDTQSVIITTLPNVLLMTVAQYQDLDPYGDMVGAYNSQQRLYKTEYNVMDIVVKDQHNLDPEQTELYRLEE